MSDLKNNSEINPVYETIFVGLLGIAFVVAFIAALTYDFVSARAPLFILAPLIILIGVQFRRTRKASAEVTTEPSVSAAPANSQQKLRKILELIAWTGLLLLMIFVAGHYVASAVFMYLLLHTVSKESNKLSIIVSICVVAIIYALFEHGFNIELSRGLIFDFIAEHLAG